VTELIVNGTTDEVKFKLVVAKLSNESLYTREPAVWMFAERDSEIPFCPGTFAVFKRSLKTYEPPAESWNPFPVKTHVAED